MYPTHLAARTTVGVPDDARASEDREAVERVLAGETAAYRFLVERHQRGVHAVIYRMVHSAADADDLTQVTFLKAYDGLADFKLELRFSSWLYRIALNQARDHLKSKQRSELATDDPGAVGEAAFTGAVPATDAATASSERERLLERGLARLSPADREVLILRDLEERPYLELKAILRRPITALKIRVVRARARLRKVLDELAEKGAL